MAKKSGEGENGDERAGVMPLPDPEEYRDAYYEGRVMTSPMGGRLDPLTVRMEDDGSGTVIFECSSSSLRYELSIPTGTRTERRKVKEVRESGIDPYCPRHGEDTRLIRVDRDVACPQCGARFGRAG